MSFLNQKLKQRRISKNMYNNLDTLPLEFFVNLILYLSLNDVLSLMTTSRLLYSVSSPKNILPKLNNLFLHHDADYWHFYDLFYHPSLPSHFIQKN